MHKSLKILAAKIKGSPATSASPFDLIDAGYTKTKDENTTIMDKAVHSLTIIHELCASWMVFPYLIAESPVSWIKLAMTYDVKMSKDARYCFPLRYQTKKWSTITDEKKRKPTLRNCLSFWVGFGFGVDFLTDFTIRNHCLANLFLNKWPPTTVKIKSVMISHCGL